MKRIILILTLAVFAATAVLAAPAVKGNAKRPTDRVNRPAPTKPDNNRPNNNRPDDKRTPPKDKAPDKRNHPGDTAKKPAPPKDNTPSKPIPPKFNTPNRPVPPANDRINPGKPTPPPTGNVHNNARYRGAKRPRINDNYGPVYRDNRYYYSNKQPYRFGYWNHVDSKGHNRRSAFFFYGVLSYLMVSHTSHGEYDYPVYTQVYDYPEGAGYYLDRYPEVGTELRRVFRNIAAGWNEGDASDITRYVRKKDNIAVVLDGDFEYYVSGEDYTDMVYDAIDSIDTYDFYWYQLKKARDGSYTGNAVHKYCDEYGKVRKVYASYRVKKSGGDYKIVEVGSSDRRL